MMMEKTKNYRIYFKRTDKEKYWRCYKTEYFSEVASFMEKLLSCTDEPEMHIKILIDQVVYPPKKTTT